MEETACLPLLVRRRDVGEPFLDLESRAWVPWGLQLPPENWEQKPRNNKKESTQFWASGHLSMFIMFLSFS